MSSKQNNSLFTIKALHSHSDFAMVYIGHLVIVGETQLCTMNKQFHMVIQCYRNWSIQVLAVPI